MTDGLADELRRLVGIPAALRATVETVKETWADLGGATVVDVRRRPDPCPVVTS